MRSLAKQTIKHKNHKMAMLGKKKGTFFFVQDRFTRVKRRANYFHSVNDNRQTLTLFWLEDPNCQMLSFGSGASDVHLASGEPSGSLSS